MADRERLLQLAEKESARWLAKLNGYSGAGRTPNGTGCWRLRTGDWQRENLSTRY
jgi:hypothetical protein